MTLSARDYLLRRFRTDGATLRHRATVLESGVASAGPNAITSRRMADACDDVVVMLERLGTMRASTAGGTHEPDLDDIAALVPALELRAAAEVAMPPVRAVYVGAATRIREILAAELSAQPSDESVDHESDDDAADRDDDDHDDDDHEDDDRDDDDIVWPSSNEPSA